MPIPSLWPREARALAGIAAAVSLTMFAQLGTATVETVLVARLGEAPLAGTVLALGVSQLLFLAALGIVTAVTPIAAAAAGRGDTDAIRRTGQQGVMIALVVALPGMLAMLAGAAWLDSGTPDAIARSAAGYLAGAAWGLPAWVVYVALRCLAVATGGVGTTTRIMLAMVPLHAVVTWSLIFPAGLGAFGAGLGASFAGIGAILALAVATRRSSTPFAQALRPPYRLDRPAAAAILRLGLPFAGRILLREGLLPTAALALAAAGPGALAAHAVAARAIELAGIGAFGFSDAINMRVSHAIGAGRPAQARHAAVIGLLLSTATGAAIALLIAAAAAPLATAILGPGDPAIPAAATLLPVAALLLLAEAVQSAAGGALSGLRDARGPLLIAILTYWLLGFPAGLALTRVLPPALGLWIGLVGGAALAVTLTLIRLHRRLRAATA